MSEKLVARCPECRLKLRGCYTSYEDVVEKDPERVERHEAGQHHSRRISTLRAMEDASKAYSDRRK